MRPAAVLALFTLVVLIAACAAQEERLDGDEVHLIGRFDLREPAAPRFGWPGATIAARFAGTSIAARFEDAGANQFDVWIDDALQPVVIPGPGEVTITLADGLVDGEHDVRITRRTEGVFGVTRFRGFVDATLIPTLPRGRRIEMIGDAITCGAGVLGADASCGASADTEAVTAAWGALAAAALDADHVAIAASGKGAYRNASGELTETMPALYARTLPDDPELNWGFEDAVDAVVINLGHADFLAGDPGQPFVAAMYRLVRDVRARRPDAWILLALSPMLTDDEPAGAMHATLARGYLQDVVGASDERVAYLELAAQDPADGVGCAGLPGVVTQQHMAAVLVARLRELTGW